MNVSEIRFRNGSSVDSNNRQNSLSFLGEVTFGTNGTTGVNSPPTVNNSNGNTVDALIKHANGNGKFHINDGNIKRLKILHTIRKAQNLIKGQQLATQEQEKNTAFTELKGTYDIKDGVIFNNDLTCRSFQYKIGETYELKDKLIICQHGFHYCDNLIHCFEFII